MVLVVDDHPDTANAIVKLLGLSGIPAQAVADGMTALEFLAREKPSLVILDLMMPGMSGIDVLSAIREHSALTGLPVMIYTASDDLASGERGQLHQLGALEVVVKRPNGIDRLIALANQIVNGQASQ